MMQVFGRRRGLGKWLVALVASPLVLALFPGEVLHPNAYLNGSGGDAIRNYYALEYYARYDAGRLFMGMNYPRGEHLNFLDLQPLLAVPLAWSRQLGLPTAG